MSISIEEEFVCGGRTRRWRPIANVAIGGNGGH
jgi:hypothetical protein